MDIAFFRPRRVRPASWRVACATRSCMERLEQRLCLSAVLNLPGFQGTVFNGSDDGTYPAAGPEVGTPPGTPVAQDLGFGGDTLSFLGTSFSSVFINDNGNVTPTGSLAQYNPDDLTTPGHIPEIAPFFADVDTRSGNLITFGTDTVNGHAAFGVEWPGVGYFNQHTDLTNIFELVLIDRSDTGAGNFDIEFNYDQIQWDTGDVTGSGGLGAGASVGYTNGTGTNGTFWEQVGSLVPGAFIDGGPNALTSNSVNSDVPGRYLLYVRNGQVAPIVNGHKFNIGVNVPFSGAVATFSDGSDPSGSDDNASIDWGDGTTSAGTISLVNNVPTVTGSHTYSVAGTYATTVSVTDGFQTGNGEGQANVSNPLQLTTPASAASVNVGSTYQINWTGGNSTDTVQLWAEGGPTNAWTELAASLPQSQGHYVWNTTGVAHGWYHFQAWDIPTGGGSSYAVQSPNYLHVVAPAAAAPNIALTNPPLATAAVAQGNTYALNFTATDGSGDTNPTYVQLWVYSGNTGLWTELPNANYIPAAQGHYDWNTTGMAPGWYSFSAHATNGDAWSYASSPGWLNITVPTPTIAITTPTSGQSVAHGATFNLNWNITGLSGPDLSNSIVQIWAQHIVSGSAVWSEIAVSVNAANGTYGWTVPSSPGAGTYYAFSIYLNYGNNWWAQASTNWLQVT